MSTARSVRAVRATFSARAKRRADVARPVHRRLAGYFGLAVICFASLVPISATARADETNAEQAAREILPLIHI